MLNDDFEILNANLKSKIEPKSIIKGQKNH